jgi:hypothetical protein
MKFSVQVCAVLCVFWQSLIFAFEFVDDCKHLGGPIFAEKDGWARIGCKTDNYFGYCTLTRKNPPLTCKIEINHKNQAKMIDGLAEDRIRFTGNAENKKCEFLIENLQPDGNNL